MKIFTLCYISYNNGETGVSSSIDIAQSTNEEVIREIINENHLDYVTELERGQDHIFLLTSYEPDIEPYFNKDKLELALQIDTDYKVKKAEEKYELEQRLKQRDKEIEKLYKHKKVKLLDGSTIKDFVLEPCVPEARGVVDKELNKSTDALAEALGLDLKK